MYFDDVDSDGHLDIVTVGSDVTTVFYGNGNSVYNEVVIDSEMHDFGSSVYAFDSDNDGDLEIIVGGSLFISISTNLGDRKFETVDLITELPFYPQEVAIKSVITLGSLDFNNDGLLDLVGGNQADYDIFIMENLGNGQFTNGEIIYTNGDSDQNNNMLNQIKIIDFNEDGYDDIVTLFDEHVTLSLNDQAGGFSSEELISEPEANLYSFTIQDFNNDDIIDLAMVDFPDQLLIYYFNPNGTYNKEVTKVSTNSLISISSADVDLDGDYDLAFSTFIDGKVFFSLNENGRFQSHTLLKENFGASYVDFADLNGDGKADLVSRGLANDKIIWFENQTVLNIEDPNKVVVYPTIFSKGLTIENSTRNKIKYSIADFNGKIVLKGSSTSDQIQIPTDNLSSQSYILKILTDSKVFVRKILKSNE